MCNNGFEGPLMAGDRRKDTKLPVGLDPLAFLIDQYPQGGSAIPFACLFQRAGRAYSGFRSPSFGHAAGAFQVCRQEFLEPLCPFFSFFSINFMWGWVKIEIGWA